ncbi:MAG: helix-turn-helix transcriptional regulator [Erysipelotrichia bacterium]|jgi:transcriptional regulator with XRE-family HTH domain|nr:helix-turn-helix transcriptional regulator [Erysipelotrichia bacterium]
MGRKKTQYTELNIKIGQRIKQERLSLNLSRQELASKLEYEHGNSVLYWEKGAGIPYGVFAKLADVFNVRIEYLMCVDDYREKYHHMMTPKETVAWWAFERTSLLDVIKKLERENYELRKSSKEFELSNISSGSPSIMLDGMKVSKQETQAIKTIIEGIRANRKGDVQ